MNNLLGEIRNIIFDFDGVIIDSMDIRSDGVRKVFKEYDAELVEKFVAYYRYNAGLSKFVKIKYFYNEILDKEISEEDIKEYSEQLSLIMKEQLASKTVLIKDTFEFIKDNYNEFNFHIASGSDEQELNYLCKHLEIDGYFKSIKGAPIHKNDLVKNIIEENNYALEETAIVGDSINDFDAGEFNKIHFLGYNNEKLRNKGTFYIENFR